MGVFLDFGQVEALAKHRTVQVGSQHSYDHLQIIIIASIIHQSIIVLMSDDTLSYRPNTGGLQG